MTTAPPAPDSHPALPASQPVFDWAGFEPFPTYFLGVAPFDASDSDAVRTYLDWNALVRKWEIPRWFPDVLDDADWGDAARTLLHDANSLLTDWLAQGKLRAEVVFGVWRASAVGNQVLVQPGGDQALAGQEPDARMPDARTPTVQLSFPRLPMLDGSTYCVADFIKPAAALRAGESDYIGGYALQLREEIREPIGQLAACHDDYRSILATDLCALYRQAVADYLHYRLRRFIWAYCDDDDLSNQEVLTGQQPGIRVDLGGRECSGLDGGDQTKLFSLLGVNDWAVADAADETDSPLKVQGGYFFAHPRSRHLPADEGLPESTSRP